MSKGCAQDNWDSYVALMDVCDDTAVKVHDDCKAIFWYDGEFKYHLEGFNRLSAGHRRPLEFCLSFFSGFDGIVEEAISELMTDLVQLKEQKDLYGFHSMMEAIHGATYTRLIKALALDNDHARRLQHGARDSPAIMAQADFLLNLAQKSCELSRCEKLMALACCECLFFCPLFAVIFYYNFKYQGSGFNFEDLDETNNLISRDETIHYQTHIHFMKFYGGLPAETIENMIKTATDLALASVDEMLQPIDGQTIEISLQSLKDYVMFQANRLSKLAGASVIYPVSINPLPWMVNIETHAKTNPFERDNMNYQSDIGTSIGVFSFNDCIDA